ncbi:unnamed protein product [Onchocerca flexuosa]|uniref:FCP1 homology domain-containing protein n=1 Tax=Onchocerca flexuosa TaxID=387005 RepID=A0A183GYQ5_9BILA|nr:unnamed protein product [Onchocerca flexuosa]
MMERQPSVRYVLSVCYRKHWRKHRVAQDRTLIINFLPTPRYGSDRHERLFQRLTSRDVLEKFACLRHANFMIIDLNILLVCRNGGKHHLPDSALLNSKGVGNHVHFIMAKQDMGFLTTCEINNGDDGDDDGANERIQKHICILCYKEILRECAKVVEK